METRSYVEGEDGYPKQLLESQITLRGDTINASFLAPPEKSDPPKGDVIGANCPPAHRRVTNKVTN